MNWSRSACRRFTSAKVFSAGRSALRKSGNGKQQQRCKKADEISHTHLRQVIEHEFFIEIEGLSAGLAVD